MYDHSAPLFHLERPRLAGDEPLAEDEMNARMRTYTAYSIAVAIVWAVLLVLVSLLAPAHKRNDILLVFAGFVIGWVSATIARYVYPPPKKYRPDAGKAP